MIFNTTKSFNIWHLWAAWE